MQGIRIKPLSDTQFAIDIVCQCGANGLTDERTGERSFSHRFTLHGESAGVVDSILKCACGRRFRVTIQKTHFHVNSVT